jgi:hypothetical protein
MPRKVKSPRKKNVKKNKRQKRSKVSRRRKQKGGVSPRTYMMRLAEATDIPKDADIEGQLEEFGFTPRRSDSRPLSKEIEELGLGSRPPSLSLEDELALLEAEAGTSPLALASSSPRRFVSSSRPSSTSSDDFVLIPREVPVQQEAKRIGLFSGLFKRSAERK